MKIHEYQAKEIFSACGIPVMPGKAVTSATEALRAAQEIGLPVVIKAQVLVGGRGKAGGVKIARTADEVKRHAANILGMKIKGLTVTTVFVTRAIDYDAELYLGLIIDRRSQKPVLMASAAGGVEIEEVARTSPEKILRVEIDPLVGLQSYQARSAGLSLLKEEGAKVQEFKSSRVQEFQAIALKLYRILLEKDCSLVEINPLVIVRSAGAEGELKGSRAQELKSSISGLLALDAKIVLDDNALYRHPELEALRDTASEESGEAAARTAGLSYVKLDGIIGCVVNGAGLAMATMDLIKRKGGEPANFLDIGGSSSPEKMATAMKILLADRNVRAVLVNIFGGITRCDDVANGLLIARQEVRLDVPIVARLIGTNESRAADILKGTPISFSRDMSDAVRMVIEAARRVQEFKSSRAQGFQGSGVQEFK